MKYATQTFLTPRSQQAARHPGALVHQGRLARRWTIAELAERARIGTATLKRIEKGTPSVSLGMWLSVLELVGLLPAIMKLDDPVAAAILDRTRVQRARRKPAAADLDF